ncbi:hypothetical protein OUZ56_021136 [Daphnia magna]|uniref:Uncharacterized protein n=1 Tax=Daphnia magna TaxID=35525 RepID=A0ABQ9ZGL0_9CRUS|nr:hypothetical protein OUZ56_021136 [Daphnia magna]
MANKPTSKECEVSKQNVCKGSNSQPKPMHPMFSKTKKNQVVNNSSTAQQPLNIEVNSSSGTQEVIAIVDTVSQNCYVTRNDEAISLTEDNIAT